jgi:hypothetical protein
MKPVLAGYRPLVGATAGRESKLTWRTAARISNALLLLLLLHIRERVRSCLQKEYAKTRVLPKKKFTQGRA